VKSYVCTSVCYSLRHSVYYTLLIILFWSQLNTVRLTHNTRHAATAPNYYNVVNHWVFKNCKFSKEQSTLPEDDRMIETCRSVLIVLL